jgi:hypothetical protein
MGEVAHSASLLDSASQAQKSRRRRALFGKARKALNKTLSSVNGFSKHRNISTACRDALRAAIHMALKQTHP